MKHVTLMALVVLGGTAVQANGQNPPPPARQMGDSMRPRMATGMMMPGRPGIDPEQLRMQVEERWSQMVQEQLGLNDQQMERVRAAQRANQDRHRDLGRREEDLRRVVQGQLQPGVAANGDSLSRSLDALAAFRVQHAQSDQTLLRDLAFLTPVQRARYFIMAQRFMQRIGEIRDGRPGQPGMQPGMQPGVRGRVQPGVRRPAGGAVRRPGQDEEQR